MIFEFKCLNCNHINSWTIDQVNISEYICKECHTPIGYSNGRVIKLYEKVPLDECSRYKIYENPVYGIGHVEPTQFYYSTVDTTTSSWYPSGNITSTWTSSHDHY